MLKVGIIGATGYTGEELVKVLTRHRDVKITLLQAIVEKELPISEIFPSLKGKIDLPCNKPDIKKAIEKADLLYLALPHTVSMMVCPELAKAGKTVIDLSADYRLELSEYEKWYKAKHNDKANLGKAVYGLPELFYKKIKSAKLIANPGCYPTGAILAIAPLAKEKAINLNTVIVDAKSGTTGAGRRGTIPLSYAEVNENLKAYKVNEHQHKPEINMVLGMLSGEAVDVMFVPHLIPMNRGILSTVYMDLKTKINSAKINKLYKDFYKDKAFVNIMEEGALPTVRDVAYTNFCNIGIKVTGSKVVVVSCIDNLLKGAAGQAVQNMNIMYGFDEKEALI